MRSEKVEKFLNAKGFKRYDRQAGDSESTVTNYYRVAYGVEGLPLCLTNDKPPQIRVREYHLHLANMGEPYHGFDVSMCNEAPQGWIDFKFYSVNEAELLAGYEAMETALFNAWRGLFVGETQPASQEVVTGERREPQSF